MSTSHFLGSPAMFFFEELGPISIDEGGGPYGHEDEARDFIRSKKVRFLMEDDSGAARKCQVHREMKPLSEKKIPDVSGFHDDTMTETDHEVEDHSLSEP